jgi:glutaredoxin
VSVLTVYSKPGCHLCEQAMTALRGLQAELGFELSEQDITTDEALHRAYFERIPVGVLDGVELFEYFLDERILRRALAAGESAPPTQSPSRSIL